MCGIVGYLDFAGQPVARATLEAMAVRLAHRGPDGSGVFINGQAGIAHRRLSIVDLEGGTQPMTNEDRSVWVVFNGEIYNHSEIRKCLPGHTFTSHSDTEAIIHAYEEWGTECVSRFRGMFAFAILDLKKRRILLARDRSGIKPLVYFLDGSRFAFASELAALAAVPNPPRDIRPDAVGAFFRHSCIPAPLTIYKNVFKLPPAHTLEIPFSGGQPTLTRYWQPVFKPDESVPEAEWIERLRACLRDSVRAHLMSDVPFGAFLSGGVDSSAIVALMAQEMSSPVRTFSIGFENSDYSELPFARHVAKLFSTDHHEEIVRPDALAILPEIVARHGEPFGDSSAIPTHYVARMAASHVKMVLSGDGGDENFAGYPWYANVLRAFSGPKGFLRRHLGGILGHKSDPIATWQEAQAGFDSAALARLLTEDFFPPHESFPADPTDLCSRMQAIDMTGYLPNDILAKVDIASMASSLESRVPLLDHHVIELAGKIPSHLKLFPSPNGSISKYILKKTIAPLLGDDFLNRKKQGFSVPLKDWFAPGSRRHISEKLLSGPVSEICRRTEIEAILADPSDVSHRLWLVLIFNEWLEFHQASHNGRPSEKAAFLQ